MTSIFCCPAFKHFRPQRLDHEQKFSDFLTWVEMPPDNAIPFEETGCILTDQSPSYVVQFVQQVNYGPVESRRYFLHTRDSNDLFIEVTETDVTQANYKKLNSWVVKENCPFYDNWYLTRYKNFRCDVHNKFFEANLYQKNPVNKHAVRVNLARPAESIDL